MFNDYGSKVVYNLSIPRENSLLNKDFWINTLLAATEKYRYIQVSFLSTTKCEKEASLDLAFTFSL